MISTLSLSGLRHNQWRSATSKNPATGSSRSLLPKDEKFPVYTAVALWMATCYGRCCFWIGSWDHGIGWRRDGQRSLQVTGTLTGLDLINSMSGARLEQSSESHSRQTTPSFTINATFVGSGILSVGFRYTRTSLASEYAAPCAICGTTDPCTVTAHY
jgi:hypothetical protein